MSVIKAGTTLTTAYTVEADTTGALEFKTGPSATLAMSISASGVVTFPATTGFDIASANITNLTSSTATITNLLATSLTVSSGSTLNGGVVINEPGADVDFRVEGDTDANLIFADASADFVGIGTSTPATKLDVSGRAQFVNNGFNYVLVDSTASDSYFRLASAGTVKWYLRNNTANTNALEITPDAGSTTGLFLTQSGNLGIGTSSPGSKLEVSGVGTFTAGTQETWGSSGLTFGASRLMRQMESTSTAREYICGPDTSTYGTYEFYTARSNGSPTLAYGVNTSGNVFFGKNISIGNVTPTTSGTGITFPATQSASSNANTLDDYEEGTWTPTFSGESTAGTTTYVVQRGGYIKIGAMVTVWCDLALSAATGTGNVLIGGLPFSSIGDVNFQSVAPLMVDSVDWGAGTYLQAYLYASTNVRIYYMADNASWAQQQVNNESQEYIFTMNYRVA